MQLPAYDVLFFCSILGDPFYRLRRGTRLHGLRARIGFDRGMGAGQLEASILAWLDRSYYGAMMARAFPGVNPCIPLGNWSNICTLVRPYSCRVGSYWSTDFPWLILPWEWADGLEGQAGRAAPVRGSADHYVSRRLPTACYAGSDSTGAYLSPDSKISW